MLSIASIQYVAEAQELDESFIPSEFLTQMARSPSVRAAQGTTTTADTQCLVPCDPPGITPTTLQTCVDLCEAAGHCCGNRYLDNVMGSAVARMSCAFGCEMAYYSTSVDQCKGYCADGQGGCRYTHPYIKREFAKCSVCRPGCDGWPSEDACDKGCEYADTLDEFYNFVEPVDNCTATQIPRFLFGGQSNMEGNSAQAMTNQFTKIINIMNNKKYTWRRKNWLLLKNINMAKVAEMTASKNIRKHLWKMQRLLRKRIRYPPRGFEVVCSYTNPSYMQGLDCERPVTPDACNAYGHGPELIFAHHFPTLDTKYHGLDIGITKVAVGGTTISQWMKQNSADDNNYWNSLVDAIHGSSGTMQGFVWFQGENDHFLEPNKRAMYKDRLTQFVSDVREEIFQTSSNFQSKEDIPVVIVEVGEWIRGMGGTGEGSIIGAQRAFVER